ncbi:MAG: helix-turn-helix transcriptional regulator [Clostridia bacterium]|nr:helix-turn-helix transcriptional regulator [Clostridia bacterium]
MNQREIGKFISELRKNKKMTQEELAEKLGVNNRTISRWENGNNMPDVSLYKPLCEELDITINELLSGKRLNAKEYQENLEENIVNTIDYSSKKINKKNNIIFLTIFIIVLLIASLGILFLIDTNRMRNNKPVVFSTWGYDYVPPINLNVELLERTIRDYFLLRAKTESRNLNNEKSFISTKTYLIKEVDYDTTIVYMWVLNITYYEDNNIIKEDSGSSIPYKITLEKSDNEYLVVETEMPRDGSYYASDMKALFPKAVRNDMDKVHTDGTIERLQLEIEEQKDNYYSK